MTVVRNPDAIISSSNSPAYTRQIFLVATRDTDCRRLTLRSAPKQSVLLRDAEFSTSSVCSTGGRHADAKNYRRAGCDGIVGSA